MGGGWWWARAARLARLRFRGALLPPPRPRSGGARGSFAPGHGPRAGASPPPVSELDRADAWLLRKAHETGLRLGSAQMGEGVPDRRAVGARVGGGGGASAGNRAGAPEREGLPCKRREALAARAQSVRKEGLADGTVCPVSGVQ